MSKGVLEIPTAVISSVETLDEWQDCLTSEHPDIMADLHQARKQDL